VILGIVSIIALITLDGYIPWKPVLIVLGTLLAIAVIGVGIGWVFTHQAVKDGWHRLCPPLTIEQEDA